MQGKILGATPETGGGNQSVVMLTHSVGYFPIECVTSVDLFRLYLRSILFAIIV